CVAAIAGRPGRVRAVALSDTIPLTMTCTMHSEFYTPLPYGRVYTLALNCVDDLLSRYGYLLTGRGDDGICSVRTSDAGDTGYLTCRPIFVPELGLDYRSLRDAAGLLYCFVDE